MGKSFIPSTQASCARRHDHALGLTGRVRQVRVKRIERLRPALGEMVYGIPYCLGSKILCIRYRSSRLLRIILVARFHKRKLQKLRTRWFSYHWCLGGHVALLTYTAGNDLNTLPVDRPLGYFKPRCGLLPFPMQAIRRWLCSHERHNPTSTSFPDRQHLTNPTTIYIWSECPEYGRSSG